MEILTREGRSSWFPSGVYFSWVRVCLLSFLFLLFCSERQRALFTPCFNHFLPDRSSVSAITSRSGWEGETKDQVWLRRGRSRAHSKGCFSDVGPRRKACPGSWDERMIGYSHQGEWSGPGRWEMVCTEAGVQLNGTKKHSCQRLPRASVMSHVMHTVEDISDRDRERNR